MKRKPAAKPASTKITLTLPNDLLVVLDNLCALENRTRANFIAYSLHRIKENNPYLGKPLDPKTVKGPSAPCPRGYVRPCERNRPATGSAPERPDPHGK